MAKSGRNQRGKPKKRRLLLKISISLAVLMSIPLVIGIVGYYRYSAELPDLWELENYRPPIITTIYDEEGRVVAEYFIERRKVVPIEKIPKQLIEALVSTEDKRFWTHHGIDYMGITRALYQNIKAGHIVRGASTLTQQLARSFYLSREKTLDRKIKEALLAYRIERDLSKQEILFLYLNQVYLGNSSYGVEAAAENYFGKTVDELSLAEMAMIAGIPKAPSRINPVADMKKAKERLEIVLKSMVREGKISGADAKKALNEKLEVKKFKDISRSRAPYFAEWVRKEIQRKYGTKKLYEGGLKVFTTVNIDHDKYAHEAVRKGLRRLDKLMGFRGPVTNIKKKKEREAYVKALAKNFGKSGPNEGDILRGLVLGKSRAGKDIKLNVGGWTATVPGKYSKWAKRLNERPYKKLKGHTKPTSRFVPGDVLEIKVKSVDPASKTLAARLDQPPMIQAGLISFDPFTGEIRAMVGGMDFNVSEFNRAMQAKRQVGSSFKPIYYAAAIEAGYNPANVIFDSPVILPGQSKLWRPRNFGNKFSGPQTMYIALTKSINTISVKIMQDIGVDYAITFANQMGIDTELPPDLTLALGTATMNIKVLSKAYATFANGGERTPLTYITRIYDRDGYMIGTPKIPDPDEGRPALGGGVYLSADEYLEHIKKLAEKKKSDPDWYNHRRKQILALIGEKAYSSQTAFIMVGMMKGVVNAGTAREARVVGWEVAGKTGTTNKFKDALFIGFTPTLLCGVWVGHDDNRLSLGREGTGGHAAAPIFKSYMVKALKGQKRVKFKRPEGIVYLTFDAETGTLPGPYSKRVVTAPFLEGTELEPAEQIDEVDEDWFRQDFDATDAIP